MSLPYLAMKCIWAYVRLYSDENFLEFMTVLQEELVNFIVPINESSYIVDIPSFVSTGQGLEADVSSDV